MSGQGKRSEFELIAELLAPLAQNRAAGGLADDAARVAVPDGQELIISTDMLVAAVHFPENAKPDLIANRLLACNISDLAAKGATPYGCIMQLGVASHWNDAFLEAFIGAFADGLKRYDLQLWGGDTVSAGKSGALGFVGLTVHGLVPRGQMIPRNGAQNDDDVYVTGAIGDGYLGLQHALNGTQGASLAAYAAPQPPLDFGQALCGMAHAAIDVSDGLLADLAHIAQASGGSIALQASDIPLSDEGRALNDLAKLVSAGDDLQIAFTASPASRDHLAALANQYRMRLTRIGRFSTTMSDSENEPKTVRLLDENGAEIPVEQGGYRHF